MGSCERPRIFAHLTRWSGLFSEPILTPLKSSWLSFKQINFFTRLSLRQSCWICQYSNPSYGAEKHSKPNFARSNYKLHFSLEALSTSIGITTSIFKPLIKYNTFEIVKTLRVWKFGGGSKINPDHGPPYLISCLKAASKQLQRVHQHIGLRLSIRGKSGQS